MKSKKILIVLSIMAVMLIGIASVSYAVGAFKTPAEIVSGLTGKSVADVTAQRQAGISYGAQAQDVDKLDEFQAARIAEYKAQLDALVKDGKLTQAEADTRLKTMTDRIEICDGAGTGMMSGAGQGMMNGGGRGRGSNGPTA